MKDDSQLKGMKRDGSLKRQILKTFAWVPLIHEDEDDEVLIEGEVLWARDGKILLARVQTESSTIEVRIFHPTAFHRRLIVRGAQIRLQGKLSRWHGRPCLIHPRIILR